MSPLTGLVALFAAAVAVTAATAAAQDASPREWNQARGNAANTAFVDVAPLKATPTERWRIESKQVLAGPVVSQSKLFAIVLQDGKTRLLAIEPSGGALLASKELLLSGDLLGLAASEDLAMVVATEVLMTFRLSGSELRSEKSINGNFGGEPAFAGTTPLVTRAGGSGLVTYDWASGKATTLAPKGFGRAGLCADDRVGGKAAKTLAVLGVDEKADKLLLQRHPVTSTAPMKLGAGELLWSGPTFAGPERTPFAALAPVSAKAGIDWFLWIDEVRGGGLLRKDGYKSLPFKQAPAIVKSRLYGFAGEGKLLQFDASDDSQTPIAEKSDLPKGAQPIAAASIARDVLLLGNWAIEIGNKRILWCLPSIEADGPAIPAGDELLVVRTKTGALVGFGNGPSSSRGRPEVTGSGGGASGTPAETSSSSPAATNSSLPVSTELPGSKPGIVRSDGLFLPGKASALEKGRWRLEPEAGPPQEFDPGEGGTGQLLQGFLEASNVDPVKELVTLIKTQRAFELNSQSIQTADQALQTIGNLRRF